MASCSRRRNVVTLEGAGALVLFVDGELLGEEGDVAILRGNDFVELQNTTKVCVKHRLVYDRRMSHSHTGLAKTLTKQEYTVENEVEKDGRLCSLGNHKNNRKKD